MIFSHVDIRIFDKTIVKIKSASHRVGDTTTLKHWEDKGHFPGKNGVSWAVEFNHVKVLDCLEPFGILPTVDDANEAASVNRTRVLGWIPQRGIHPTNPIRDW